MRCIGYGDVGDAPVLTLTPLDAAGGSMRDIVERLGGEAPRQLYIEFVEPT